QLGSGQTACLGRPGKRVAPSARKALPFMAMRRVRRAARRLAGTKSSRWQSRAFRANRLPDPLRQTLARVRLASTCSVWPRTTWPWWGLAMTKVAHLPRLFSAAERMRRYRLRRRLSHSCVTVELSHRDLERTVRNRADRLPIKISVVEVMR